MDKAQACLDKLHQSMSCWIMASFFAVSGLMAAEAPIDDYREVTTYYQITTESLDLLTQRVIDESQPFITGLQVDVQLEDYVAGLNSRDYARLLEKYIASLDDQRFDELVGDQFSSFYDIFVDKMGDDEFAAIFRQYLGELTASYLTSVSSQDFIEYVVSRILLLTEEEYSNLYQDYIATLWRYYVNSATPAELIEILGDDYPDPMSSANLAVEDERYFDMLAQQITNFSEAEFIANYRSYITEMTGGFLVNPPPIDSEAATDSGTETETDTETEGDAEVPPENLSQAQSVFTDLSTEESVKLIRRHIASVGKSYFVSHFNSDILNFTSIYTDAAPAEQLALLLGLDDFEAVVQQELATNNANNEREISLFTALSDDVFLEGIRAKLQFVENIPYPNLRLLRIAASQVLEEYMPNSSSLTTKGLSQQQFQILANALFASVVLYDESGPIGGQDSTQDTALVVPEASEGTGDDGDDIRWNFLGCGCEIEPENIIYGFYPTWELPEPGSPPQEIDLRFYDRVAYFGLTLNEQGDISADDYWREGGILNKFIQEAHIRNTKIDLGIYSPTWHLWDAPQLNIAAANIVDKLSIPLKFGLMTNFAANYLVPIYPTYSETVGKNTMGDGVTLFFDHLEDPETGRVRNLDMIVRLVTYLSNELEKDFSEDFLPINLMLDFNQSNTEEILRQLRPLIVGTATNRNQYVSRVLIFLEQDTWSSSQELIGAVRTVFKEDDSAAVLRKLNPILVPAMDEPGAFPSLTRDLRDLRWTFGNAGGAAIWPIPLQNLGNGTLIQNAFNAAMVDDSDGFWQELQGFARIIYFKERLSIIFTLTGLFLISMIILIWSIREPIKPIILMLAKGLGFITFVLFMLSKFFIDPYINPWRVAFFLLPVLFVLTIVPLQSSISDARMSNAGAKSSKGGTGNRYVDRQVKRQKSRLLRKIQNKIRRGIRKGFGG